MEAPDGARSQTGAAEDDAAETRQILVKFDPSLSDEDIAEINRKLGASVVDRMLDGQVFLVEVRYPGTRDHIIDAYAATEGVVYAEPNQLVSIPEPPGEDQDGSAGNDRDGDDPPLIELPQVD